MGTFYEVARRNGKILIYMLFPDISRGYEVPVG